MTVTRKIWLSFFSALTVVTMAGCGQINDDLSDCLPEPDDDKEEFELNYELKLVTNMTTELQTQLNTVTDVEVSDALKNHLQGVFRDYAHDVDLSFFDTESDSLRLHHENHIMNDNESSYTLYLPMREYMHLASANILNNSIVSLQDNDKCHHVLLSQAEGDTINSHETGIFTARSYMNVLEGVDQTFNVKLFMANAAAALVVDTTGVKYKNFRAYTRGFATDFQIADSAYIFAEHSPYVRATELALSDTISQVGFCTVSFPSRNPNGWWVKENTDSVEAVSITTGKGNLAVTRAEGQIIPEGEIDEDSEPLWEYVAYVTLEDGSVTVTRLTLREPLLSGELKIIKARMDSKGIVKPQGANVGVSITLDWNEGVDYGETEL